MMTTNLSVIAIVKQLRTDGSFRNFTAFSEHFGGVGVLNSVHFQEFSQSGWVWHDFGGAFRISGWGGVWTPQTPPRDATDCDNQKIFGNPIHHQVLFILCCLSPITADPRRTQRNRWSTCADWHYLTQLRTVTVQLPYSRFFGKIKSRTKIKKR